MKHTNRRILSIAVVGPLLYLGANQAASAMYPHFWTSKTIGAPIPWYFMGRSVVDGTCSLVALIVLLALGGLASRRWGREVWQVLLPPVVFLTVPVGQGLNVLLHTSHLWSQEDARSRWESFDAYMRGEEWAATAALVATVATLIALRRYWMRGPAQQGASPAEAQADGTQ